MTDLQWDGDKVKRLAADAAADALRRVADDVFDDSQRRVPVDTGDLKRSGRVRISGDTAIISYQGVEAVIQHERLDYRHDRGEPKYLETAVNRARRSMGQDMATEIRKKLS